MPGGRGTNGEQQQLQPSCCWFSGKGLGKQSQDCSSALTALPEPGILLPERLSSSFPQVLSPWDTRGGIRNGRHKSPLHETAPQTNGHRARRAENVLSAGSQHCVSDNSTVLLPDSQDLRNIHLGWATAQEDSEMSSSSALFPIKMDLIQVQIKFLGTSLQTSMSAKRRKEKALFYIFFPSRKWEENKKNIQQQSTITIWTIYPRATCLLPKWTFPIIVSNSGLVPNSTLRRQSLLLVTKVKISNLHLFHASGLNPCHKCGLKEFYSCSDLWNGSCSKERLVWVWSSRYGAVPEPGPERRMCSWKPTREWHLKINKFAFL